LTLSRSGMLGFLCGLMVIAWANGMGRKMVRFLGVMFLAALAVLPLLLKFAAQYSKLGVSDNSATARLIVWARALGVFLENPWFGIGFNTYGFYELRHGMDLYGSATYSAEGGVLFVAVLTGL